MTLRLHEREPGDLVAPVSCREMDCTHGVALCVVVMDELRIGLSLGESIGARVDYISITVYYTAPSGAASATVMLMGGD
ncbi:MAG: hypothetical protein ACJ754_10955 [Pyrinomonadaceae bacterium]